jgi:NTP pyrophosphatase (non-canonical NTP hydrolase)
MAAGRTEGRVVREYLEALRSNKPKRGRKRTPESINARLAAIATELAEADPIRELELVQEKMNLETELESLGAQVDMSAIEDQFVKVAQGYGARKGISYAAWRAVGVEPSVLKKAGISRST